MYTSKETRIPEISLKNKVKIWNITLSYFETYCTGTMLKILRYWWRTGHGLMMQNTVLSEALKITSIFVTKELMPIHQFQQKLLKQLGIHMHKSQSEVLINAKKKVKLIIDINVKGKIIADWKIIEEKSSHTDCIKNTMPLLKHATDIKKMHIS